MLDGAALGGVVAGVDGAADAGVGEAVGTTDAGGADADAEAGGDEAVGEADAGACEAVGEADAEDAGADADADADADGVAVGAGDGVGLGLAVGTGVGRGVGFGVSRPLPPNRTAYTNSRMKNATVTITNTAETRSSILTASSEGVGAAAACFG